MLEEILFKEGLSYTYTDVDNYVWIKRDFLPDGKEYYSMVLV